MKLIFEKGNEEKEVSLDKPTPLKEVLKTLNICLESVIIVKNKTICLEDELVEDSDTIELLSVISGG